jgi:hypothetical protein
METTLTCRAVQGAGVNLIRAVNLAFAVLAVFAPMAHVLELPNKLALDAALWLAVQQHLYRGWGPFIGAPTELGALFTSLLLVYLRRRSRAVCAATVLASLGYVGMLAAFFVLNKPVNVALASWTAANLPPDWTAYRARWEAGHAIAAAFALASLTLLIWAYARERRLKHA